MGRKLASVQRIGAIEPIPGADAIECARVLGWQCVVKKGEFKEGDLVVYFEVDSFLPIRPEFEFLRKGNLKKLEDGTEGFRLRTIRLRGQISQGLVMPMSILEAVNCTVSKDCEGLDLTGVLGVRLWQPPVPACLRGKIKGSFPSFIPKTDETRVQVLGEVIKRHAGTPCYITEKVDGSSITFYLKDGKFGVCSRNLELDMNDEGNAYVQAAKELQIEERMRNYPERNYALQGELFGNGIQGNPLGIEGREIRFFNAFDIDKFEYYDYWELRDLLGSLLLEVVPVLSENWPLEADGNKILEMATGPSQINPKVLREGIVIRPLHEKVDLEMAKGMGSGRLSFKAVSQEYLLKHDG